MSSRSSISSSSPSLSPSPDSSIPITPFSSPDLFDLVPGEPFLYRRKSDSMLLYFSPGPSKTLQFGSEDQDMNAIVRRLAPNGVLPPPVPGVGYYGDRTREPSTLADALSQIREADLAFSRLPATVRAGMDNDPRNLVAWLADPDNSSVARKHGLLKPLEPKAPGAAGGEGPAGPSAAVAAAAAAAVAAKASSDPSK